VLGCGLGCKGELASVEDVVHTPSGGKIHLIGEGSSHLFDREGSVSQYLEFGGGSIGEKITRTYPHLVAFLQGRGVAGPFTVLDFLLLVCLFQPQLASCVEASQVCQPEGEVFSPGWSLAHQGHVVTVISPEGGHADAGVVVVVIGELRGVEEV
jgi:hypothetical protein